MDDKIFIPFSEDLFGELMNDAAGGPLGELVPYQLEYRCVRLLDGTFEFDFTPASLPVQQEIVHAA